MSIYDKDEMKARMVHILNGLSDEPRENFAKWFGTFTEFQLITKYYQTLTNEELVDTVDYDKIVIAWQACELIQRLKE